MVLLYGRSGPPVLVGVVHERGIPSDFYVIERADELVADLRARVAVAAPPPLDTATWRRLLALGVACMGVGVVLLGANLVLERLLSWSRGQRLGPSVVGAMGLLIFIAALRMRSGALPLVSPLYNRAYVDQIARFLVMASVVNFALLWAWNAL